MNKIYLHTNNLQKQLKGLKREMEAIRDRRRELMFRLNEAGFSAERIGEVYGCSRQYVEQEISKYKETLDANSPAEARRTESAKVTA